MKTKKSDISDLLNKKDKKNGGNNLFVRFADSLEIDLGLRGDSLIFESKSDMIKHHKH